MNKSFYLGLCYKDLSNDISDDEKKLLVNWINESEKNRLEYESVKSLWLSTAPNKIDYEINLDEEWINLKKKMAQETRTTANEKKSLPELISSLFTPKLRPILAMSAALILIVSSILFLNNYEPDKILKIISTSNNQRLEVKLSDGSIIQLNSDSQIQFFEDFEKDRREIKLNGEAFFSVNKDGRPFIISTNNATTTVLGTKFNVWSREDETRVLVKEGTVSLADNNILNKVILNRGELSKVIESQPPVEPSTVDADYMLGWLDGKLVFDNSSLIEIAKELERAYDVKVDLNSTDLSEYNLTGSFNNEKIDTVLSKICLALNLKYVEKDNNYNITK